MVGYVYILKDEAGKFYIGSTDDIDRRMGQHRSGHTQTTRRMNLPGLVFNQVFPTLDQARKIEKRLKQLKRKDYIEKIIREGYIKMK